MSYNFRSEKILSSFFQALNLFSFSLSKFYLENPCMIYAIFFLLGIWVKLSSAYLLGIIPFLIAPLRTKFVCVSIFLFSFFYCLFYYPAFPHISLNTPFTGKVKIISITPSLSFKKGYIYKGRLKSIKFEKKKGTFKNIPCNIKCKGKKISGDYLYQISGFAESSFNSRYSLTLKAQDLIPIKKIASFTEKRKDLKEQTSQKIKELVKGKNAAIFLTALVTGNISDSFLTFSFRKTGLQHILAISGFHFSILMLFFLIALRKAVPFKTLPYILIIITNVYFLYIGFTPSIFRAYLSLQIALFAQLLNKKNYSVNTLGLITIFEVMVDPLILLNLGFQLSFLSVAAIFIIYPQINLFLSSFLIKRTREDLASLDLISKIGGTISNFARESIALSIGINLALIPILLLYFHKFPLLSFIYNLFFPPLIFISIFLLALASIFSAMHLHLISQFFGFLTSTFTEFILKFPLSPPAALEYNLYSKSLTPSLVVIYLCICFFLFITLSFKKNYIYTPRSLEFI